MFAHISLPLRLENCCTAELSACQVPEGPIGAVEWVRVGVDAQPVFRCDAQEFDGIRTGVGSDADYLTFPEKFHVV
ncbi:hypothetical protein ACFVW2_41215, partial [Streptomyces sp. NPDC058171]